jgi:transcriptional regulator with XRE-family HTH domain
MSGSSGSSVREDLADKEFRHAYAARHITTGIAYQIRALREQRGWSQAELGRQAGKPQSVISRLESPDYGKLSVQTLLELAAAFDVALMVRFVSFSDLLERTRDLSPEALAVPSFGEEGANESRPTRDREVAPGYPAEPIRLSHSPPRAFGGPSPLSPRPEDDLLRGGLEMLAAKGRGPLERVAWGGGNGREIGQQSGPPGLGESVEMFGLTAFLAPGRPPIAEMLRDPLSQAARRGSRPIEAGANLEA